MNMELMLNNRKKWIIAAAILTGVGVLLCTISFAVLRFNLKKLGTVKYVSNTYKIEEAFRSIHIAGGTEDISFVFSDDGNCKVVCREEENHLHQVHVENNTLMIDRINEQKLQLNFGISTESPEIIVYLPQKEYELLTIDTDTGDAVIPKDFSFETINTMLDTGDMFCQASANGTVSIETDTGNITVSEISAAEIKLISDTGDIDISDVILKENIEIEENTGNIKMKDVSCKKFTSSEDTGDLIMTNVIASEEFHLESITGNITFNGCDAETISAKTTTGNVSGTLLSEKVFLTESDTGNIDVPKTMAGGKCEIITDTGNINIKIQ